MTEKNNKNQPSSHKEETQTTDSLPTNGDNAEILELKEEEIEELMSIVAKSSFSGPVPPPDMLKEYGDINESFPERFVTMAESNLSHKQELQKKEMDNDYSLSKLGAFFGFIIGITGILCGTIIILKGHEITGTFIAGGTIASLVGTFVYGVKTASKSED